MSPLKKKIELTWVIRDGGFFLLGFLFTEEKSDVGGIKSAKRVHTNACKVNLVTCRHKAGAGTATKFIKGEVDSANASGTQALTLHIFFFPFGQGTLGYKRVKKGKTHNYSRQFFVLGGGGGKVPLPEWQNMKSVVVKTHLSRAHAKGGTGVVRTVRERK